MILPWQQKQWMQLMRAKQEHRLPHALLLTGIAGIGKAQFADAFAQALLCQQPTITGVACTKCHACRMMDGRVHPNILWIEPEKTGQAIKVDQIRLVSDFIHQTALQGDYRIILIHPANSMNISAANALLKSLEEPTPNVILILLSDQSARLPATILSRCHRVLFSRPETNEALEWMNKSLKNSSDTLPLYLSLANGAPLAALQLMKDDSLENRESLLKGLFALAKKESDPIQLAASIEEDDSLRSIDLMLSWIMDVLRLQLSNNPTHLINHDFAESLSAIASRTHVIKNAKLMGYLQQIRTQLLNGINFNKPLLLESLFIRWMDCVCA